MRLPFYRRKRMSVRTYRRPIPIRFSGWRDMNGQLTPPTPEYEEMFVVLERPLLEFTRKDLVFLREQGIDPFGA